MKKLVLAITLFVSFIASSQESGLWITVNDVTSLVRNPKFISLNAKLEKAFPASRNTSLQNVYHVTSNIDDVTLYTEMHKVAGVCEIEYAPAYETLSLPNDFNTAFANDYALNLINAVDAWDITTGDSTLSIGISDSNFDFAHIELFHKQLYISPNIAGTNYSHGTAVAITAAGNTDNGIGKSSIGYNTHMQFYGMTYNELLVASYNGCKVINASWASGCSYSAYGQAIIDEIYNNGSIVVAAAGNGTTCGGASNLVYPAAFNHVIAVTSVGPYDNHERIIGDTNSTHQHNASVDICAPGYDVALAIQNNAYITGNGSSFAAPYVSGTVALMLAVNPCLTYEQIDLILKTTAVNINTQNPQYLGGIGAGRLNSAAAVLMAANTNTMTATLNTTVDCSTSTPQLVLSNISSMSYTTAWSNGSYGDTCNANVPGLYIVEVTDSMGCKFVDSIHVQKYDPIIITTAIQDIRCNGEMNGKVEAHVVGGCAPYTYSWDNGSTTQVIAHVADGLYSLTVEDSLGCTATVTAAVNEPAAITTQIQIVNDTIDLQVAGGTPGYTYQWNTGAIAEDLTNVSYGFYEVLIMDTNGCMSSANVVYAPSTAGIDEYENTFNIYPNPSNGSITINSSNDIHLLSITNMDGQLIVNDTEFNTNISLTNLAHGMYLINVDGSTQKLIVK